MQESARLTWDEDVQWVQLLAEQPVQNLSPRFLDSHAKGRILAGSQPVMALWCLALNESAVCGQGVQMGQAPASMWDLPAMPRGCAAGTELLARGEPGSGMGKEPGSQLCCGCGAHQSLHGGVGAGKRRLCRRRCLGRGGSLAAMSSAGAMGSWHQGRAGPSQRRRLRGMLWIQRAAGPSAGSTSLGGMQVLEPGWGPGLCSSWEQFGAVQISAGLSCMRRSAVQAPGAADALRFSSLPVTTKRVAHRDFGPAAEQHRRALRAA